MTVFLYLPIVLSLLVLGAHFLRYDNVVGVFVALALLGLLFVRRVWAARVVQAALLLGALEWAHTLYRLVQVRAAQGLPATRMIVILGIVIGVCALSAWLLETKTMKRIYRR